MAPLCSSRLELFQSQWWNPGTCRETPQNGSNAWQYVVIWWFYAVDLCVCFFGSVLGIGVRKRKYADNCAKRWADPDPTRCGFLFILTETWRKGNLRLEICARGFTAVFQPGGIQLLEVGGVFDICNVMPELRCSSVLMKPKKPDCWWFCGRIRSQIFRGWKHQHLCPFVSILDSQTLVNKTPIETGANIASHGSSSHKTLAENKSLNNGTELKLAMDRPKSIHVIYWILLIVFDIALLFHGHPQPNPSAKGLDICQRSIPEGDRGSGQKLVVSVVSPFNEQCLTNSLPKGPNWKPQSDCHLQTLKLDILRTIMTKAWKCVEVVKELLLHLHSPNSDLWCSCKGSPYQTTYFASELLGAAPCQLPKGRKWMVHVKVSHCEGSDHSRNCLPIMSL